MTEFCHCEEIERFMPAQMAKHLVSLFRGKNTLFTHTVFVETGCIGKLLQVEMC